ncbi:hypothetical protein C0995_015918 [Termitomyces sp. Mi166|nr:hypothetical protein C0995_015918 [Termitomyces sp. Mi166\
MLRSLQVSIRQYSPPLCFLSPICRPIVRCSRSLTTKNRPHVDLVASDAQRQTIYALSTPPGKGGVAVIRISGPDALLVWNSMVKTSKKKHPEPWKMERCRISHPFNESEPLDDGLAVYFKGPRSFTTEDVVELHLHSGRAIISSVLGALSQLPFCRPAEAGEFTRRAFLGGRLDLTQVEGLKDLINAETETQRRMAMVAAGGAVRAQYGDLRSGIIGCLANVEALIDFGEGEDIEEGVYDEAPARSRAQNLLVTIQRHLQDNRRGEIIRSGVRLAIFGPPNAGKRTHPQAAQREAAIVTSVPGTTRDILELSLDINGLPVIVADTAGVRATDDLVESIGIERARKAVQTADISLCVLSLPDVLVRTSKGPCLHIPSALESLMKPDTLILFNKSDLVPAAACEQALTLSGHMGWAISLTTGEAISEFLSGFAGALQDRFNLNQTELSGETPLVTRERHRVHLESACRFLQAFLDTAPSDIVLAAEELRYAAQAVGKVSGLIDVEDILDAVFKDFCIGK